jgi:formate dehydrogenase major subunit
MDPNVQIQESKAGSCDIRPGRRPQGEELLRLVAEYQSRAGSTVETGNVWLTDPAREIIEPPVGDDRGQEAGRDGERR